MKQFLSFLLVLICLHSGLAQNIYPNFTDGQMYLLLRSPLPNKIMQQNPRGIMPMDLVSVCAELKGLNITKVSRPFFTADDDRVLPQILKIEFTEKEKIVSLLEKLNTSRGVSYAEKVPLHKTDATPNEGIPTHLAQINAANAWNVFNGNSNITVAIVDNAVMWTHVDLVQNTYTNTAEIANNSIDDDGNGYVDDVNGWDVSDWDNNAVPSNSLMNHGTHCAGIAAGRTDNNTGIASIGWNVKMIPVKCQTNGGNVGIVANGFEGILYASKAGARVISCSFGSSGGSTTEQSVVNYAWNRGSIIMASASNSGVSTMSYPGAYNNVYCVAAVDPTNVKSNYSNYGTWVDICAPGDAILSTIAYTGTPAYLSLSGTSMATPMVAGLAALMLSKSPNMTRMDVLNCINSTAANIYTIAGNSSYSTGNLLGAGRIEAYLAMQCAATYSALPPIANFYAFPRNTCPNTNVLFNDSSLYAPTAWSWTFQSGSPATSTSSNPVVQWASPGTYSVAMTCSNTNGSSSITKLSYITVSGPLALPFVEGFENITFLPVNWTDNNIGGDNIYWTRRSGLGAYGTSTACAMFDNYTLNSAGDRDEMRSPKYSFSNIAAASLRFDVAYARYDANFTDTLEVKISTNCGASWTPIYLKGGSVLATAPDASSQFTPSTTQWRTEIINISTLTAGQGNVMFTFINRGHYGQALYLDNINIAFPTPTLSVTHPASICVNGVVQFTNNSTGANDYAWSFPGGSPATSTLASPSVTYNSPGTYSAYLIGNNGPSTVTITRTINVSPYPTLTLTAPTNSVCAGTTVTLSASGATTYVWGTTAASLGTGSNFTTAPTANTTYTVAGTIAVCTTSGSVNVSVTPAPNVNAMALTPTACAGATVTLVATGATTFTWNGSAVSNPYFVVPPPGGITVYTVVGSDGTCSKSATVSVNIHSVVPVGATANPAAICNGAQAVLTATGASTYTWASGTGASQTVTPSSNTTYTLTGSDGVCSATAQTSVSVAFQPTVSIMSIPSGSMCSGNTATFIANGASTYSWSNNLTSSLITVSPSVTTVYTVTGTTGTCASTKTISANVYSIVTLSGSASSPSLCSGSSVTITMGGASTYSWSHGPTGGTQVVSPTSNTTYVVTGSDGICTNTAQISLTVVALPALTLAANPSGTICYNSSVSLTASGANTYSWSSGLPPSSSVTTTLTTTSIFTLTGTSNGCSSSTSFTVPVAADILLFVTMPSIICSGSSTTLNAIGATSYSWSTGSTNSALTITPTATSTYVVTGYVNNCSKTNSVIVQVQPLPVSTFTFAPALCNGTCNGSYSILNTVGTSPFTYSVNSGCMSPSCNNLCTGNYTLTTIDGNFCINTNTFTITQPSAIITSTSLTQPACGNCANGSATVAVSGGTTPYNYNWAPSGGSSNIASNLSNGCYTLTIKDGNLCIAMAEVCLSTTTGLEKQSSSGYFKIYPNPSSGLVHLESGEIEFRYAVYNAIGQKVLSSNSSAMEFEISLEGFSKGVYLVEINSVKGTSYTKLVLE